MTYQTKFIKLSILKTLFYYSIFITYNLNKLKERKIYTANFYMSSSINAGYV